MGQYELSHLDRARADHGEKVSGEKLKEKRGAFDFNFVEVRKRKTRRQSRT